MVTFNANHWSHKITSKLDLQLKTVIKRDTNGGRRDIRGKIKKWRHSKKMNGLIIYTQKKYHIYNLVLNTWFRGKIMDIFHIISVKPSICFGSIATPESSKILITVFQDRYQKRCLLCLISARCFCSYITPPSPDFFQDKLSFLPIHN